MEVDNVISLLHYVDSCQTLSLQHCLCIQHNMDITKQSQSWLESSIFSSKSQQVTMQTLPQVLTYLSVYSFTKMLIPALIMALCRAGPLIHCPMRWERPLSCSDCNMHWLPCSSKRHNHKFQSSWLILLLCVYSTLSLLPGSWYWGRRVPRWRWKEPSLGPMAWAPSTEREGWYMFPASAQTAGRSPSWRRSWHLPSHKKRQWYRPSSTASLDEKTISMSDFLVPSSNEYFLVPFHAGEGII